MPRITLSKNLVILFALAATAALLTPNALPYPAADAPFSDFSISHYPNALEIQRALWTDGTIPLWSDRILSGYPLFANPLSSLYYPPHWLVWLLPLPWGLNLIAALHLVFGVWGMFGLLRDHNASHGAASIGALAFAFMPKLWAHYGAGHLTLIYALALTPWLLRAARQRAPRASAVVLALVTLADPRWLPYATLLWATVWFFAYSRKTEAPFPPPHILQSFVLLSAPLLLPLLEYTTLSTRAALTPADTLTLSLPPARLLGLFLPDWGGGHEWTVYPGAVALALALAALLSGRGRIWGVVAVLGLLWSLGELLPGAVWLARLPGVSLLRVPPRALFAVGIAWSVLAGFGWDALHTGLTASVRKRLALTLAAISAFAALLSAAAWIFGGTPPLNLLWGSGMWGAVTLGAAWTQRMPRHPSAPAFVFLGLLILDGLAGVSNSVHFRNANITLNENAQVARFLAGQPGDFRVYSPSYSLPQQTAAFYGLKLADGVDPLQLAAYAGWMESAGGVPHSGYSVTLPPLGEDVAQSNAAFMPDARRLAQLNVRFVTAAFEIRADGLREVARFGETHIYENDFAHSAAWLEPGGVPVAVKRAPNWLTAQVVGAGRLVFAEVAYPGWQAFVDGAPAPLLTHDGVLRAVDVPPGMHTVTLVFRPPLLWVGLSLAALGILGLVWRPNA